MKHLAGRVAHVERDLHVRNAVGDREPKNLELQVPPSDEGCGEVGDDQLRRRLPAERPALPLLQHVLEIAQQEVLAVVAWIDQGVLVVVEEVGEHHGVRIRRKARVEVVAPCLREVAGRAAHVEVVAVGEVRLPLVDFPGVLPNHLLDDGKRHAHSVAVAGYADGSLISGVNIVTPYSRQSFIPSPHQSAVFGFR